MTSIKDFQDSYDSVKSYVDSSPEYRCLICLFQRGAQDSHNMFIPYGESNPNLSIYEDLRPSGVRYEQSELSSTVLPGTDWALNPHLTSVFDEYLDGNFAIVQDVGPIRRPTTKDQFLNNKSLYGMPTLYGHNTVQSFWERGVDPAVPSESGWMGRLGNVFDPYYPQVNPNDKESPVNPDTNVNSTITSYGSNALQVKSISPLSPNVIPPTRLSGGNTFGDPNFYSYRDQMSHHGEDVFSSSNISSNLVDKSFVYIFNESVQSQIELDQANDTDLPTNLNTIVESDIRLSGRSKGIIKNTIQSINNRADWGQKRQVFFINTGGWDHHESLRDNLDSMLPEFDAILGTLVLCLKEMGVYGGDGSDGDNGSTVIFTQSDFGRTFRSNGNAGTDHAWSGHSFVLGGDVNGGIYPIGYTTNYSIPNVSSLDNYGTATDVGSPLGRYIPQVSTEQYYARLLNWIGVPEIHLDLVLPNIGVFTEGGNLSNIYAWNSTPSSDNLNFI